MNYIPLSIKALVLLFIIMAGIPCYSQHKKPLAHTYRFKAIETGVYGLDDKAGIYFSYTQLNKRKDIINIVLSYGDRTDVAFAKDELMLQYNYGKSIYNLNKRLFVNAYLGGFISTQRTVGQALGPVVSIEFEYYFTRKWAFKTSGALQYYSPLPDNKNVQWRVYGGIRYILGRDNRCSKKSRNNTNTWCK